MGPLRILAGDPAIKIIPRASEPAHVRVQRALERVRRIFRLGQHRADRLAKDAGPLAQKAAMLKAAE